MRICSTLPDISWCLNRPIFMAHLPIWCVLILSCVTLVAPAKADLRLCNKTDHQVGVAIGYRDQIDWITEGWWNLAASSCETLVAGPLNPYS